MSKRKTQKQIDKFKTGNYAANPRNAQMMAIAYDSAKCNAVLIENIKKEMKTILDSIEGGVEVPLSWDPSTASAYEDGVDFVAEQFQAIFDYYFGEYKGNESD